jgi:hypothetical protein
MATEDLPEEVSLNELQSDCQERWQQQGGETPNQPQNVQPSSLPQPQPGTEPTPEHAVTPASGADKR